MPVYDRISKTLSNGGAVLLDGGVGSELVRRGVRWRWHGLRTEPERVRELHADYIAGGADVIRTNTFQLNQRVYFNVFRNAEHMRHIGAPGVDRRAEELIRVAVGLAQTARETSGREVAIAGVMSPLEHCFRPDLSPPAEEAAGEHAQNAQLLADCGVDLLLLESMNTVSEARAAATAARDTGLPVWVSLVLGPENEVLSGESLVEGAKALGDLGVEAVLVNCAPPEDIGRAMPRLRESVDRPVGGFAHIGQFDPPSWKFEFHPRFAGMEAWPPARYAEAASRWRENGAQIIGGCCGTGPDHVKALREAL